MVAPLPEHKFNRLVREYGCILLPTSKEYEIITKDGQFVCSIAISHKKGSKREIKPVYIKRFLQAIESIRETTSDQEQV